MTVVAPALEQDVTTLTPTDDYIEVDDLFARCDAADNEDDRLYWRRDRKSVV